MKIIGKVKDYYDGVVHTLGIDSTIIYVRNENEISVNKSPKAIIEFAKHLSLTNIGISDTNVFIIGFCGKLYVGWKFFEKSGDKYTIKYDLNAILENHRMYHRNRNKLIDTYNEFMNFDAISIFIEYNTPIFIYDTNYKASTNKNYLSYWNIHEYNSASFVINPILSKYDFYKKINAFEAFQQIQMFIGNILTNKENVIEIEDKYKIIQHGFDKWSFRKEPSDKKK